MNSLMITAQDGVKLACHQYTCPEPKARLIFLHGSSFNSRRYANFAKACVAAGFEAVLCDWRGHGSSEGEPGTCDYVGQLEDDLANIIDWFAQQQPLPLILGGHSSGSVVGLRYIEKYGQQQLAGCYFIAPVFTNILEPSRFDAPSSKVRFLMNYWREKPTYQPIPASAAKHIPKVSRKNFWLAASLPFLRHRTVVTFPGSEKMAQLEGRVLPYSFNLMASISVFNYSKAFGKIEIPIIFVCGKEDEMLSPNFLPTVAQWYLAPELDKEVHMLDKLNHMSVINGAARIIPQWLQQRWGAGQ